MRFRNVLVLALTTGVVACTPQKEKPEDFGPRFEAAARIKDAAVKDMAFVKIADDALAAENAGATSWAISQIADSAVRDAAAEKAADYFVTSGRREVAGAIAESISDDAKRDKVMQKLAATKEKGKR